jgi:hypothetical protein
LKYYDTKKTPTFGAENFRKLKDITKELARISELGEKSLLCNLHIYDLIQLIQNFEENPIVKNVKKLEDYLTNDLTNRL